MSVLAGLLWVAMGGALGSFWRIFCIRILHILFALTSLLALFLVNVLGCFLAGFMVGMGQLNFDALDGVLMSVGVVGFLGSYTSMSAFGLETFMLISQKQVLTALTYVLGTLFFCMAGFYLGWVVANLLWG